MKCHWIRFKHSNELFDLVFSGDSYPEMGETLTDANGIVLMIVDKGHREGNSWVLKAHVIFASEPTEEQLPVDLDFIDDQLPIGYPIVMNGVMWVKKGPGDYVINYIGEQLRA